jgi:peptidoglycan hydrolase-like protein with peptidoglycan-binding domain
VKTFQRSRGLVADGVVGPKTWAKLNASAPAPTPAPSGSTATIKQGASGAAVKNLQTRLRAHGYNVSVDGAFGPATASAVRSFQSSKGLTADGVVGPKTWAALNAAPTGSSGGVHGNSTLAAKARAVAMSMGGYHSQGLCATGVSRAIMNTYGIRVYGNGNQIDDNLPKNKFKQVNISLSEALKIPGLIITWEKTSTVAGSKYGHTAITLGDGHSSASDFIENNTTSNGRTGMKIFMPI